MTDRLDEVLAWLDARIREHEATMAQYRGDRAIQTYCYDYVRACLDVYGHIEEMRGAAE